MAYGLGGSVEAMIKKRGGRTRGLDTKISVLPMDGALDGVEG